MKKIYTLFTTSIILIVLMTGSGFANSNGVITQPLSDKMASVQKGDLIRVNITLVEQYDAQALLSNAKSMKPVERREYVISTLKEFSSISQKDLLADLQLYEKSSDVKQIKTYWIANVINCYATSEAIEGLSYRYDIASIDYDEMRMMLDPEEYKNGYFVTGNPQSKEITWNVTKVNADDVWALGFTGEGVIVAVLDTGVNYNHYDLNDHMWINPAYPYHGYDFVNNDNNPMDDHGHGTHCAGTVAGDGTAGSQTGVAPDATIMACKVMDSGGSGSESGVWSAVEFSIDEGAQILSLSLGWQHSWGPNRAVWRQTFDNVLAAGVIASVAAGNEGDQQSTYPIPDNVRTPGDCPPPWLNPDQTLTGGLSSVICVGSTTSSDNVSGFSGRGPVTWSAISPFNDYPYQPEMGLIRPDIAAPGSNIKSLDYSSNNGYASGWSGTSMATPCNAGMLALMLQKNNILSPEDISQIVEETAFVLSPGKNNNSGSGRIDCLAAVEATSLPGPSYYSHNINDASGNNNGMMDPGESVLLDLTIANFSEEVASDVTVKLSVQSDYVTITDSTEYYGDFALESIIEITDAFAFDVANNIPGGDEIKFTITCYNSTDSWESSFNEMAYGVNLAAGSFVVSDVSGNNNGGLDPGETADILIETLNTGQLNALSALASITSFSSDITINSASFDLGTIEAGQSGVATFNITVSPSAPVGSSVDIQFEVISGFYSIEATFYPKVGLIVEDFETGDFSQFDWDFSGNQPWTIVSSGVYEGVYAAKTGAIGNNQSSEMFLTYEVGNNDSIAFYRKVSSEANYDFLEFYIDNDKVGEWAGEVDWSRVAFAVSEGEHIFRWAYVKDVYVTSGSDCAWVDYIELPAMVDETMMVNAGNDEMVCEGEDFATNAFAQNFNTLLWETSGTGTFDNYTVLEATYTPSDGDYLLGAVTLSITVYGDGGAELTDNMELSFNFLPEMAGTITGPNIACSGYTMDYEVAEISYAYSYNWVLSPAEAGVIDGITNNVSITWDESFVGNASLKVQGVNECGEGDFSEELDVVVEICTGIDELSQQNVLVLPNPNNGNFTLFVSDEFGKEYSLKLLDLTGKVIYQNKINKAGELTFQLSDVEEGLYFLLLENGKNQVIEKIIIRN
ncbi:MAG: S8 family serine peptidase [Bacteroidales bacterium]|nr:S8 family serine peptidase [Bacteroidales bacterium]MCF8403724.1 S8 family serine peptidase [Bacteroidales bacterium]